MSSNFYAFLNRMKYIDRWALMRNTKEENLSQHSFEVAAVAYALCVIGNRRLGKNLDADRAAALGLFHDAPEILTGDMPTPVKYFNTDMKDSYKQVEKAACDKLISTVPPDLASDFAPLLYHTGEDEYVLKLVKAADKISALIKCVEERKAGNKEFEKAETSSRKALERMNLKEADIFIEEFLPPFKLTLDQLT